MNNAKWISIELPGMDKGVNPWETPITEEIRKMDVVRGKGLPLFRKVFDLQKEVRKVIVKATSMGIYDLFVNGKRVGNDELKPGWTDYRKRVLYYEYDITDMINRGLNCISSVVSLGWWQGRISLDTYGSHDTAFMASVDISYTDGSVENIVTDTDWKCTIGGAILNADIWDGEVYDARIDNDSFKYAAFDDSSWVSPKLFNDFTGDISKHVGPTIRERDFLNMVPCSVKIYEGVRDNGTDFGEVIYINELQSGEIIELKKGQTILLDIGQNMVGWPKFTAKGSAGTTLAVRFAEMLNDTGVRARGNDGPKGSIYTANYRSAKAKLFYTFKGDAKGETYNPTHTFYGFRYMEFKADNDIVISYIKACVIGSDTPEKGKIKTSNEDVNKLISNVLWGQRGNYLSIPTDCPQRDERLGWTGDTQIFVNAASYNADVQGFFHKWMQDMRDSQSDAGAYPDVAPRVRVVGEGNAAWADAGVIVPYVIYRMYGDLDIIRDNFESMDKYVNYLKSFGLGGGNAVYGDWLSYEPTDHKYIACCCFAIDMLLMIEMARAINSEKLAEYEKLYEDIKGNFRETYMKDGKLTVTSQTGYLLALRAKVLPEDYVEDAVSALEEKIVQNGHKLSTGFIGTGILNQTLSEYGKSNLAYSLLLQTKNPSWLYSVYQGATTIWERWNSYTIETGFGDVGMNSFNHYAYGAVLEWMYRYMAGIETTIDAPGFKHVVLRPMPDTRTKEELPEGQQNITFVEAEYESVSGLIKSSWRFANGKFIYQATVPVNATLYFPLLGSNKEITINGKAVTGYGLSGNTAVIELAPGSYTIY